MILKRLFPARWAKILAWTGASLAWGTTLIAVAANAAATDGGEQPDAPVAIDSPTTTTVETTTTTAPMPDMPERGLVVVRYTPVPPPRPQVVTRTVTVAASSGGGGSTATATPAPAVAAPVESSGS